MKTPLFAIFLLALCQTYETVLATGILGEERRAADTCADPSLTAIYYQGYSVTRSAHILRTRWVMVSESTTGDEYAIQGAMFRAWEGAQPFTVPLFQLPNGPSATDIIYLPSLNGSAPTAPGFLPPNLNEPVAFVYPTQVCGSVPLFVVSNPTFTDHWYTTDPAERDALVKNTGWVNGGVVTFVLPLVPVTGEDVTQKETSPNPLSLWPAPSSMMFWRSSTDMAALGVS
ncbi:hypothetical protein GALMADRAFT_146572 [Galerina marginata CBS 339.88]|uniref:DUF5648 domain-containing protein n=1 Tax=Galerina marginata (strain CBS 339.88) TaxID=685588 RepID=A0A067SB36_GALM3|nr:hypothetical protein GALMADRAFT_146572 [Galerina marginata CBS 339.88]